MSGLELGGLVGGLAAGRLSDLLIRRGAAAAASGDGDGTGSVGTGSVGARVKVCF